LGRARHDPAPARDVLRRDRGAAPVPARPHPAPALLARPLAGILLLLREPVRAARQPVPDQGGPDRAAAAHVRALEDDLGGSAPQRGAPVLDLRLVDPAPPSLP